jgi:hypothetical protein
MPLYFDLFVFSTAVRKYAYSTSPSAVTARFKVLTHEFFHFFFANAVLCFDLCEASVITQRHFNNVVHIKCHLSSMLCRLRFCSFAISYGQALPALHDNHIGVGKEIKRPALALADLRKGMESIFHHTPHCFCEFNAFFGLCCLWRSFILDLGPMHQAILTWVEVASHVQCVPIVPNHNVVWLPLLCPVVWTCLDVMPNLV